MRLLLPVAHLPAQAVVAGQFADPALDDRGLHQAVGMGGVDADPRRAAAVVDLNHFQAVGELAPGILAA